MRSWKGKLACAAGVLFLLLGPVYGATYYVDQAAGRTSDDNSGSEAAAPAR